MYVREQVDEICMEAVNENGWALKYVKKQTPKICLEVVRKNGLALKYVEDQMEEICREALKQNKLAIKCVKDKNKYRAERCKRNICKKANDIWLFTVGCQTNITKEEFIYGIYNENGGLDLDKEINVNRKIYLDFLKKFVYQKF
ncbi:DUF4116 domain-containing protein [Clostridioides difficile]|nr:DUF4116 domain-containing protein [Clostridioides difficile]